MDPQSVKTFDLNEYIKTHRMNEYMTRAITCKNGFTISVQASKHHYSRPKDSNGPWTHVECGFPSERVEELMEWADDAQTPTETVYGYVPVEVVEKVILAHGGVKEE